MEAAPSYKSMGYVKRGPLYDLSKYSRTTAPSTAIPDDLGVILRSNGNTSKDGMGEAQHCGRGSNLPRTVVAVEIAKLML